MKKITVCSLGPGNRAYLTLGALDVMQKAPVLLLRTDRCDAAAYLREADIAFDSLDFLHEECEDFDELIDRAVSFVLDRAKKKDVVYAVFDASADETVRALSKKADVTLLPGVSQAAPLLCAAKKTDGAAVCPAMSFTETDGSHALLITELDSRLLAGVLKLKLLPVFGETQPVLFFLPEKEGKSRRAETIPLSDLDRQKKYDHTAAALLIPRTLCEKERYSFADLVVILQILRGENGCPWDKEQTHESLRPYLIEEAYETAAAIDDGDTMHIADELGDVLLQVVFQANIGAQYGTFELSDVTTAICKKMIRRHPHIFSDVRADSAEEVSDNWEAIKRKERGLATQTASLMDVSPALPPLMRAEKVQKKAAQVRFDFDGPMQALKKVYEEADEVAEELKNGRNPAEELGDLFFSCVNAARLCGVESETALMGAVEKFIRRFRAMENMIKSDGKAFEDLTTAEMDVYWNSSKHRP